MSIPRDVYHLLNALRELLNMRDDPVALDKLQQFPRGICSEVTSLLHQHPEARLYWMESRDDGFRTWCHFSGVTQFPVPFDHDNLVDPAKAYQRRENMWTHTYGAMRWDLVMHLITYYQEQK